MKLLVCIPMFESGGRLAVVAIVLCLVCFYFLGFKRLLHPSHILNFVACFSVHLLRDGLQVFLLVHSREY